MMGLQEYIVILIVLVALGAVVLRVRRSLTSAKSCDCSNCPVNDCDKRV